MGPRGGPCREVARGVRSFSPARSESNAGHPNLDGFSDQKFPCPRICIPLPELRKYLTRSSAAMRLYTARSPGSDRIYSK
jgi:hypothetical protein